MTTTGILPAARRKAVMAGGIGNFVEWFDFALYAQFATIIAAQFFPATDPAAALLSTFAVYAVGFLARPLGGIIFGHFGDRVGRKAALSAAVLCMSAGTIAIGLTPSYATIGVAAPILLVCWRVIQGLSAGGEYAGSSSFVIEYAPEGRRARFASINPMSVALGTIGGAAVGLIVTQVLSTDDVAAWGWRIPFLIAGPLGLVGLYLRTRVQETPEFEAVRKAGETAEHLPIVEAFKKAKMAMVLLFGWSVTNAVGFYLLSGYMITYMTQHVGLTRSEALTSYIAALLIYTAACPVAGIAADRWGRRPVAIGSTVGLALVVIPSFQIMGSGSLTAAILGQGLFAIFVAAISTLTPLFMVEMFPTEVRYTASALAYNIAYAALGGTAPLVATWLVTSTGDGTSPGLYLFAVTFVGMAVAVFGLRHVYRSRTMQRDSSNPAEPQLETSGK